MTDSNDIQTLYNSIRPSSAEYSEKMVQALYAPPSIPNGGSAVISAPIQALYAPPSIINGGSAVSTAPMQALYAPPSPTIGGTGVIEVGIQKLYAPPRPIDTPLVSDPVQELYAPPRPTGSPSIVPVQALYAPPSRPSFKITRTGIDQNIKNLSASVDKMRGDWNVIKNKTLTQISSSWAGDDCDVYVQKINNMSGKIENSFKALELLANTYQKAINQVSDSQQSIKNMIDSI